jgi:DNA-binding MarR family transcriptional regulator
MTTLTPTAPSDAPAVTVAPTLDPRRGIPGLGADAATVDGLVSALEELGRAQRESATATARELGCARSSLAVLRILEKNEVPLQIGDLAHSMRIDVSVASRQVGALVREGHVVREVGEDDRRARTLALTDSGRALAAEAFGAWRERAREVFGDWSPDELQDAVLQLRKIADSVVRHHDTPDHRATGKSTTA